MLPNWLYGKSKSKLASILGGGATPEDYNQVKAQVNQNTQDITGLLDNLEVNGAVNIASNNMTNQTALGVTFTVGDDGAITASGTATGNIRIDIGTVWLKKGITYRITDTSDLSESDQYQQLIVRTSGGTWIMASSNTGDIPNNYTPSNDFSAVVTIVITSGQTVSKTFYPMVSVVSYTGPYVPYAKTNKELTEDVSDIAYESLTDYGSSEYTLTEGKMWQTKGVTFLYITVTCTTVSSIESGTHIQISTIPSKFKKPQFNMYLTIGNYRDGSSHIGAQLQVLPNGIIAIRGGEAGARYSGSFSY